MREPFFDPVLGTATTVSTGTYLLPIVAVSLGAIVLGEPIARNLFAGTIIVLAGVALSDKRRVDSTQPIEPGPEPSHGVPR